LLLRPSRRQLTGYLVPVTVSSGANDRSTIDLVALTRGFLTGLPPRSEHAMG
jgi:hypothetical protein